MSVTPALGFRLRHSALRDPHLAQSVRVNVVHEPAHRLAVGHERAAAHAQDRLAHVRVEVGERLDRPRRRDARRLLQLGAKPVVAECLHAAVGVMDQHHLARAQAALRDSQRADHIVGDHPTRIAQHVRLAVAQAQRREHVQARVHARHHRQPPAGLDIQMPGGQRPRERAVVLQQLVDRVHP